MGLSLIIRPAFPAWKFGRFSMSLNSRSFRPQPLPEKIANQLREARWLAFAVLAGYLAIVLFGYSPTDPGWSHAVATDNIANPGGRIGAWISDLLLHTFGLSVWWIVIFLGAGLAWGLRKMQHELQADRRSWFIVLSGFCILILASCALESLRFHRFTAGWPLPAGGMIGAVLGRWVQHYLGYLGGTFLLLMLVATGLSLSTGISWLSAAEHFGGFLIGIWNRIFGAVDQWQDRMAGKEKALEREEVVSTVLREMEEHPPTPIRIEPVVVDIPKSEKLEKREVVHEIQKRQQPLFEERMLPPVTDAIPPLSLLDEPTHDVAPPSNEVLEYTSRLIENKLKDFGVEVKVLAAYPGPVVTRYEIEPAVGVKGSQVVNLAKDLARALSLVSIRVIETVPGKSCMALELPNPKRQTVRLSEIIGSDAYQKMISPLTVVLGKDIGGLPLVADLAKMPHLLVAGTTGSGKSVGINAMILSLIYKSPPDQVRMIMIDPKMLELSIYEGIPHLLAPVVTDMKHAGNALNWCVGEMDKRYKLMSACGVRNLAGFNKAVQDAVKHGKPLTNPFSITPDQPEPLEPLPYIVVIVDELADLMMVVGKKIEELIARLAQKARAAGIHLVLATQRPSVDVITGLIKANVPTRISFQVSSKIDSRTILDQMGAESLLGMGDMLYLAPGTGLPVRAHGAFVADDEVHRVVEYLKRTGPTDYIEGVLTPAEDGLDGGALGGEGEADAEVDPLYDQAVEVVLKTRRPSISLVQRHLRIGYNRSARLIEQMERAGIVSSMGPTGGREILVPPKEGE